ncbi:hypothetical protein HBI56_175680 [Parastagonospora nodorum]|uniref:Uncharacterized protein n=1 Tax=Phaeosphaeria nodorum (strain SN15 / ATCC MYA-4574 / FGSC 10173) TaxID=321614 RepID=A0A7U2FER6_PHANO|nr:hypothetical protein HBH56_121140 [Parastagonospora nodorum]QRD03917.1 hypothetical protein JI435_420480 [Parastagonospora nodorum SN15]KAH3924183.1 hypothetical protein HBH54_197040 [Parastagonospora nodorum]KAH3942437.1 hypothetical protein HBH53_186490 [Parastagonospora nodorum]KAH3961597.1 hypothetical protein HBH51_181670 [Parastagonospora nodorum]
MGSSLAALPTVCATIKRSSASSRLNFPSVSQCHLNHPVLRELGARELFTRPLCLGLIETTTYLAYYRRYFWGSYPFLSSGPTAPTITWIKSVQGS